MVDLKINLLKNRPGLSERDYQREQMILRYSILSLICVVVVVLAFSLWSLVLTRKTRVVEESLTSTSKQMQGLSEANAQQVYLANRLKLVSGFLSDRSLTRLALQKILSTDIPGAHVAGVVFEDEVTLGVAYEAEEARSLKNLLDYYQADTDYFTNVESSGLSRDKTGKYQLSLSLTLPKGAK